MVFTQKPKNNHAKEWMIKNVKFHMPLQHKITIVRYATVSVTEKLGQKRDSHGIHEGSHSVVKRTTFIQTTNYKVYKWNLMDE